MRNKEERSPDKSPNEPAENNFIFNQIVYKELEIKE